MPEKCYLAIDLKSFYASVACVDLGLDPLDANLVVADVSRTDKTICLAVSPSLKALGVPGRARLFEVKERVRQINAQRRSAAPGGKFSGKSCRASELKADPSLELDFRIAAPTMSHYMEVSAQIYGIYLRHVAPEDIHVYSIDEVFIDATGYLGPSGLTGREFARQLIGEVLRETGVTATAGIGTNLYLCKIAMDIEAKHMPADRDGVRIAELDEAGYRHRLWNHRPLTDFWRIGRGYADKLEKNGMRTMGDIALCSLQDEERLYRLFGVNAELLIDHAWGWEPCTIADIKAYRPSTNSISSGQVLQRPYRFEEGRLIVREMADSLALELVSRGLVTDQLVLTVGYDVENLKDGKPYRGAVATDAYGRRVPKEAHGSLRLSRGSSSSRRITEAVTELYDRIVRPELTIRRAYVVAGHVVPESGAETEEGPVQLSLFPEAEEERQQLEKEKKAEQRERKMQKAVLAVKKKYGKNAILRGMDLEEGATGRDRNNQVGGHRS